jgi:hypothetical protein
MSEPGDPQDRQPRDIAVEQETPGLAADLEARSEPDRANGADGARPSDRS